MAGAVGEALTTLARFALTCALLVAAAYDLKRRVIPNGCSCAVAASAVARALARCLGGASPPDVLARAVAGGAAVLAVMLAASALSRRARGEAGVGGGDVKLLSALGMWLGPGLGLACVALSCLAALAARSIALARRVLAGARDPCGGGPRGTGGIPLGPGIAVAALSLMLLGA